MSIVFKPTIPAVFSGSKAPPKKDVVLRRRQLYTKQELQRLVTLRVHGFSFIQIAKLIKRGQGGVAAAINHHNLHSEIRLKRKELLDSIMEVSE